MIGLRQPARNTRKQQAVVRSKSIPTPILGWNARDALADMKETEAVILDNWFPTTSDITLRRGYSAWATGLPSTVQSLMEYASPTSRKLKAASGTAIYDVTASGAVGAAEVSSLTNARWQYVNFGTSGGHFLIACNGQDAVRSYDGTTWASPAITGLTPANAIHVNAHKNRLWFTETGTLTAWYLGTSAIAGAATAFNLYSLATLGGTLLCMATWTVDGGSGSDDFAVFITNQGEVIVYAGTDPAAALTWTLQGVYRIGRPIGRRCYQKIGGDLVIICEDGFYPLSQALITGRANPKIAVSDKISGAVAEAARAHGTNFGWQPLLYPRGQMGIFNIPTTELVNSEQFVVNTQTGAWCRFAGINAFCWALSDEDAYFGGNTKTYLFDDGNSDAGDAIEADVKPAFSYFRTPTSQKRFTMIRPIWTAGNTVKPSIMLNVDFEDSSPESPLISIGGGGTPWGSPWGSSWGGVNDTIFKQWQDISGIGFAATARMRVSSATQGISLQAIDYLYESGGYL